MDTIDLDLDDDGGLAEFELFVFCLDRQERAAPYPVELEELAQLNGTND